MKRFSVLAMVALFLTSGVSEAAGLRPVPSGVALSLAQRVEHSLALQRSRSDTHLHALIAARAVPGDLQIPAASFSPAVPGPAAAVTAATSPLAKFHPAGYTGMVGGVVQSATDAIKIGYVYQGALFSDSTSAAAAYHDGVQYWTQGSTTGTQDCSSAANAPCTIVGVTDGTNTSVYSAAQVNACLVETFFVGPAATVQANLNSITTILGQVFAAGVAQAQQVCPAASSPGTTATSQPTPSPTVQPTPSPTARPATLSFSVDTVSFHKNSKVNGPAIHKIKKGKKVYLFITWTLNSGPANARPAYTFQISSKGHTIAKQSFAGGLSSYPADSYDVYVTYKVTKVGKYRFTGSVTINGQTRHRAATIKVVK